MQSKTNRQVLAKAVKELSEMELVFLRDRIIEACNGIIDNEEEVRKQMENHMIHPNLFINSIKNIKAKVDFEAE